MMMFKTIHVTEPVFCLKFEFLSKISFVCHQVHFCLIPLAVLVSKPVRRVSGFKQNCTKLTSVFLFVKQQQYNNLEGQLFNMHYQILMSIFRDCKHNQLKPYYGLFLVATTLSSYRKIHYHSDLCRANLNQNDISFMFNLFLTQSDSTIKVQYNFQHVCIDFQFKKS